jgi:hypothetical protein
MCLHESAAHGIHAHAYFIAPLLLRFDPRALVAIGLILVSLAFFQGQRMPAVWHEPDFIGIERSLDR